MPMMDLLLLILALVVPVGWGQVNNNRQPEKTSFYLDDNSDCNGPVRELYGQSVRVKGHGAFQEQQGPESCTLTLKSTSNFDHTNLLLEVVAANIVDCDVQLVIYDGDPGQGTLKGYDCHTPNKANERNFVTTGDVVSFILERKNVINTQYDIEIVVTPLISGNKPGYENDYGDTWGFFKEKLENDTAIGIVGAAFLLVIILVVIGIIVCYRRYLGRNKPWEQHQLSTFRPPQSIYETKSKMSDTSSDVWASNMSRGRAEPPRRRVEPNGRMGRPSEDDDSVFDDASDIAPKKYLVDQDRRWERQKERERERERQRGRGRETGSQNSSYVQADDDHPQDTYVERIIEPRTRSRRVHKPPSYNEAINESDTEKSDIDDDDDDEDDDVHKNETSEEESEEPSSEQEEEEDDDDEEEEDGNAAAPKPAPRLKPQQHPHTGPLPPGMQPHPAYPGYPPMGYMGGYPMGPGQFVPIMAAPPPGQPFPAAGPGHPPPRYPGQRPPAGNVRPTEPPIYSYLVQRGYTPLESGQEGPPSHNTSRSQGSGLDEPDRSNLASGVDYMTR